MSICRSPRPVSHPRRLPQHIREQVERDLRWYRQARNEVEDADARIATLTAPTTASLSYIGATTGTPGNPTCNRGIAVAAIDSRVKRDRFAVEALTRWLSSLHSDDYRLLSLRYAIDVDEPRSLYEAARGARIPCDGRGELRAVEAHLDALLRRAARALRYRIARGRPSFADVEVYALA